MKIKDKIIEIIMIKIFLRDRSLGIKLLVYTGFLVVIPMLIVGLISYKESSKVLENETKQYSLQIIEQVKNYVEDYFRDFEISTIKILNHPEIVQFLKMEPNSKNEGEEMERAVRNVLKNSAYSRSDITNITIIVDEILISTSEDQENLNYAESLEKEYWYSGVHKTGPPKIISRIIHLQDREEPVISIVKRIVNPHTLEPFGMLVIDVNYKRLRDVTRKVMIGETGFLYIVNDLGHYVYYPDISKVGLELNHQDYLYMQESDYGAFISSADQKNFLTYSLSPMMGWTFVTSIPYEELKSGTSYIGRTIILTIAITLIIAYIIGVGFTANLVRPVKKLHAYMKRVEKGDFKARVEVSSKDEIGLLSHGFNNMVGKLSNMFEEIVHSRFKETEMILRQRETELKVLQSQMNPHFLYNCLETIRGMALEKDSDDIAAMSSSLARLMRYNLQNTSSTVTIQQEIDICEIYLRIQKFRFEEKLEYIFQIPDELKDQQIAKFSLQPLIENCMIHGVEPNLEKTWVTISAQHTNSSFSIEVSDTGVGIIEEKLSVIRDNLRHQKVITEGGAHIGMINVHQRNQYIFGEAYGLEIESIPNVKTTLRLKLPFVDQFKKIGGISNEYNSTGR